MTNRRPTFRHHHVAISVRNLEASLAFYEAIGYKRVHRYDEDEGAKTNVHLQLGDSYLEMFRYTHNESTPPLELEYANNLEWVGVKHLALATDDIDACLEYLREKGLADDETVVNRYTDLEFLFIQDPDGVWVEFINDRRY